jgi:hypothetical protein
MDTKKLPTADVIEEKDLTDASYWKPIYEEIKRIQEQRELMKSCVVGAAR